MKILSALLLLVAAAGAQPAGDRFFLDTVYPALERAECRMCHNDNGVASATRLRFPPAEAKPDAIQVFGLKLSALVNRKDVAQSPLLLKPTMRMTHAGGERIVKGSPEEESLKAWISRLAALNDADLKAAIERASPGERKVAHAGALRRLTHSQYNNTVRDLLGDFTRPADQFPQEDFLYGFTNQMDGQSVPPLLAEAYTVAAEKLAANAFRLEGNQALIPCKPASPSDSSCRDRFIRQFGQKAFRRPLTEKEVASYAELFAHSADEQRNFAAGAKVVVEAMLQSPSFLFHLEEGPDKRSSQYATASRLSYFLWDTMPDDGLLSLAAAGKLGTPEDIRRTASKMMDDARAKRAMEVFLAQWMRFDRVLGSARNVRRVPDFGPSLLAAMTEETKHLFNHVVWSEKNFMELFSADYTFVSARLAQLYGMPSPADDFGLAKYPPDSKRAGVLGHAGFLTLTGNPAETSPTARGLFVREHFLCQTVPPPPPGVDTTLPAINAEKPMTTRDRLAMHVSNKSCAGCHSLIDPIGHGLEGFDNIGRSRDKMVLRIQLERDAVTHKPRPPQTFELDLDTNGFIQGISNSKFSTAAELGNILANDPTCQRCVVKQIFRYALGRHENESDQRQIDALYDTFRSSGFRFRELLLALVISPPFLGESSAKQTSQLANVPRASGVAGN